MVDVPVTFGRVTQHGKAWKVACRKNGCLLPGDRSFVSTLGQTRREMPQRLHWILIGRGPRKRIVGWIAYGEDVDERGEECWWIHRMAVDPAMRRLGIAQMAICCALDEIPFGNEVLTSVVRGNRRVVAMLRKLGFRRTRRKWQNETVYRLRKNRHWK